MNARLLGSNVGHGVHVKLRLRSLIRVDYIYPYDQVVDMMLHELCHDAMPSSTSSGMNLDRSEEYEELRAKGLTGTGQVFNLPRRRLGGFSKELSISSLRQTALAAAEKGSDLGSLLPSGPSRLGSDSSILVPSPAQAAVMAAG